MARLDYEKANRRELPKKKKRRRLSGHQRAKLRADKQQAYTAFVAKHSLVCFKCGRSSDVEWAKTGITANRHAWAICVQCVASKEQAAASS